MLCDDALMSTVRNVGHTIPKMFGPAIGTHPTLDAFPVVEGVVDTSTAYIFAVVPELVSVAPISGSPE